MMMSLEGKPFFVCLFVLLPAISYQEKHRWSHLLRSPLCTYLKINVLMVERLEMLLVGSGVLGSLSGINPEGKSTFL